MVDFTTLCFKLTTTRAIVSSSTIVLIGISSVVTSKIPVSVFFTLIRKVKLISRNIFSNRSVLFYIQSIIYVPDFVSLIYNLKTVF